VFYLTATIHRLLLTLICLAVAATAGAGEEGWAVVEASGLRLRETPSAESRVLSVLPKETRVQVAGRTGGWLKVVVDGTVGYVSEKFVRRASAASAAGQPPAPQQTIQNKARDIDRQITRRQAEMGKIREQEQAVIADLDAVEQRLNQTRSDLAKVKGEQAALRGVMNETDRSVAELEAETCQVQDMAARRLTALYKLNWLGRVQILAAAGTVHDFAVREKALRRILAADEAVLERFHRQRCKLEGLLADQARQQQRQTALEAELQARLQAVDAEQTRRNALLAQIRGRKALEMAAIEELQKAALRLDDTLRRLEAPPVKDTAPSAKDGASPTKDAPPPAKDETPPARKEKDAPPDPKSVNLSDTPFHARKGLLKMPVSGEIVHFFGPYRNRRFNVTNVRGGIDIRAEKGEPIRAVHAGRVLFADWFKGYGNLMIIDHGDAYYTVYAHMEEMLKPKGAPVKTGDVIATVGETGSLEGPMLYFELRHRGKPVDPMAWLKTG
jgi:septal ring factor EnvC (AmiA/AmiB activator)